MQTFLESFTSLQNLYEFCIENGIKGHIGNPHTCVICEMIKTQYPERFENGEQITVFPHNKIEISRGTKVISTWEIPPVLSLFAYRFDMGRYPDLLLGSKR